MLDDLGDIKQRNFRREMAQAGDFEVNGIQYARMQMLTVAEILEGKRFQTPSVMGKVETKEPLLFGFDGNAPASGQQHREGRK